MNAERALNIIIIALELIASYISLSFSSMFRGIHDGLSILFLVIGVICAGCMGYMCYLLVKKNKGEKLIMKRYKLLKDLPTFKAGEEFCLSDKGALVFADKHSIVAYSKKTLREFPNILRDWFEEIEENEEESNNNCSDTVAKYRMFNEVRDKYNFIGAFDDRPKVTRLYQELGLTTFFVGEYGREF